MDRNKALRDHLLELLRGGHAHVDFERAVDDFPVELAGRRHPGVPHTAWQLVEHLRIAQWDIVEFSRSAEHFSPDWPDGYWPGTDSPAEPDEWHRSLQAFRRDQRAMQGLVADARSDLLAPFPWGSGQTLLREAMLVADHNAYHLGQLVDLRRLLGAWPPGGGRR